jgi:hypothetical protein
MSTDREIVVPDASQAEGLLLRALREGKTDEITWAEVTVGDLVVQVASDAMKATVNGTPGVRLPMSYAEAVALCAELDCVSPTQAMCDAMFAQAKAQLNYAPLPATNEMGTVSYTLRFHERVQAQLQGQDLSPGDLVFGAWKLWILHPRIAEKGAVNYGFWDKSQRPVKVIQSPGAVHNALHSDYSQLFVPVKRMARRADTGEPVDLCDYIAAHDRVPAKYLAPYRKTRVPQPDVSTERVLRSEILAESRELERIASGQGTLASGARGPATKALQQALIALKYAVSGGADGVFGQGTAAAVKRFQANSQLAADGIVGKGTILALDAALVAAGV